MAELMKYSMIRRSVKGSLDGEPVDYGGACDLTLAIRRRANCGFGRFAV